ncbi:zinc-binding dehydrogenase [Sporosarcina sp. NCCP-2222]|uniref:quinone oxidoreductase family protein n=1 Tax=Sporosarcina sp. NCCP-2222 TaxID=2935073 RepID=UPI00283AAA38|nr:zinc-binding dehydrogenase [Sporosarcina sp. NCCP-2222]
MNVKAIIQKEFGGPDVLLTEEIERPKMGTGECLLKVAFTSVNYADIKTRRGNKGNGQFPLLLGLDAAGIIEEAHPHSGFSKGDRVVAFPKYGSYAEYVIADERLVFKIPESLSFEQAAAMPTVSFLAFILLHEIGQIKKTDTIVIHSAAGGVGSMLVQLAKSYGTHQIICTVGHMDKGKYVKDLGADIVCTYDSFVEEVLYHTAGQGANVIFDSVAGEVTGKSLECLALYGTLVQFGNSSGLPGTFSTNDVHSSCRSIKGFSLGTTRKHDPARLALIAAEVIELVALHQIALPIAHVFSLQDASEAHRLMESRKYEGKILLRVE